MNTTSPRIAAAVAAALGLGAVGQAWALPPASFAAIPESNRFYIGGATATDNSLRNIALLATGGLCSAGTADLYEARSSSGSLRQTVILCEANSSAGALFAGQDNQNIALFKESLSGSANGISPLLSAGAGSQLQYLNVGLATGCSAGTSVVDADAVLLTYTIHTACTSSVTFAQTVEVGISDVNPRLFGFSSGDEATLDSASAAQVVFAPTVSLNFRNALQTAQGLTSGSDTAANVPSLTKTQLTAIFQGSITNVSQLTNQAGDSLANADDNLYVCRRGNTSGTQVSFARYFLNAGCAADVEPFVTAGACTATGCTWSDATFINTRVFAGAGSGDVRNCLDGHHDAGDFAVGVTSTEALYDVNDNITTGETSAGDDEWRFVKLTGELPTLEAVANGNYDLYTENTVQRRPGLDAQGVEFRNWLLSIGFTNSGFASPAAVAKANADFRNTHGDGGLLVIPNFDTGAEPLAPLVTQADLRATPISSVTRSPSGVPNNCNESIMLGNSAAGGALHTEGVPAN